MRRGRHVRGGLDFENAARRALRFALCVSAALCHRSGDVPPVPPAVSGCCSTASRCEDEETGSCSADGPALQPARQPANERAPRDWRRPRPRPSRPRALTVLLAAQRSTACSPSIVAPFPDSTCSPCCLLLPCCLDLEFHPHGTELTTSALLLWHSLSLPVAASISCAPLVSASPERASTPPAGAPASLSSISLLPDPYHDVHAPTQHAVLVCPFPLRCSTRGHAPGKSKTWLIQHSRHLLPPPTTLT